MSQHMDALAKANKVRLDRAAFKRMVSARNEQLSKALLNPPDFILSAPIAELLRSQPRWGYSKVRKFLAMYAIFENRKVRDLTTRQRQLLAAALKEKGL